MVNIFQTKYFNPVKFLGKVERLKIETFYNLNYFDLNNFLKADFRKEKNSPKIASKRFLAFQDRLELKTLNVEF